ncbi:hypothetical protein C427_2287 [Paraglaciecola psychrophila 170]|uniref:Uncharacterized protein n=1 Tax=Paraglaciecola psychrophila 170 TaxID=1129794 RepID=K6YYX3_9ALTE|nr:hypothetical protein C427_2287 [Paraglaciecola psychrophila 170]GAC37954.1 hypothetical protein GPSY_2333 [Paraglaciecola psychrophila 170]
MISRWEFLTKDKLRNKGLNNAQICIDGFIYMGGITGK